MGRFVRRLFVLLILFTIAFLIYRYINPVGASIFVEKAKAIPDRISEFMKSDKEAIIITGTTLTITGDVDAAIQKTGTDIDTLLDADTDLTWLEELNLEIEKILGTGDTSTVSGADGEEITGDMLTGDMLTGDILTGDIKDGDKLTGANIKEVNLDTGDEGLTGNIITGNNLEETDSTPAGLSDTDYKQVKDVFGNLVE